MSSKKRKSKSRPKNKGIIRLFRLTTSGNSLNRSKGFGTKAGLKV